MKLYVGIDPGEKGAIAAIKENHELVGSLLFEHMNDPYSISEWLRTLSRDYEVAVALEKVGAMPGQGVVSMFNFGRNVGGWEWLLQVLQLPVVRPRPQEWQEALGIALPKKPRAAKGAAKKLSKEEKAQRKKDAKIRALRHVQKEFPDLIFRQVKDEGVVDAICIALYMMQIS